jgi:P2 family phage contractile tail tube protein
MKDIPTLINDANVYVDEANWLGKSEVELPSIAHKVIEMKQFGISGSMEVPLIGHIDKLDGKIKFKAIEPDALNVIYNPKKAPLLDVRAAQQKYNTSSGEIVIEDIKITMRAFFKNVKIQSMKQGSDSESEADYAAHYFKMEINGQEVLEIDKFNYIYKVNGEDILAEVRSALGQ